MAVGSGIGASFGTVPEVTWGTQLAVTRWLAGRSFSIEKQQEVQAISGVAAGRFAPPDEVVTSESGTGKWEGQLTQTQFGLWLQHLMGSSAAPVQQAATTAYLQTHNWGDNFGKGLTCQMGTPNAAGTANPVTGVGGKITKAEFSCGVNETLAANFEFDFKQYTEVPALAAPSFVTANQLPFKFNQMSVKLGTFASEAAVQGVRKVTASIARPMDVERKYAGNAGLKSEQIYNGMDGVIGGSLDVDLVTKADFMDRWVNHTATSLVWEFVSTTAIASTYFWTWRLTLPRVYFGAGLSSVDGPDVIKGPVPFTAFQDPTNGFAKLEYMSTDVAV